MRPTILHIGGTLYWTIQTYDPDKPGVLKDADSTPSVAVRKNGASSADSVTITKRSATTGLYDCSYNPAAEVEGDTFQIEETATVTGTTTSSATYTNQFSVRAVHAGAVALDSSSVTAVQTGLSLEATSQSIKAKTDNLPSDPADQSAVEAAITAATSPLATPAQVNAQVVDALSVDTYAELTAPPAATSSLKDKITWLFMYARNKVTQTATQRKLYRDDGTTVAGTSATDDTAGTFTKGEDA